MTSSLYLWPSKSYYVLAWVGFDERNQRNRRTRRKPSTSAWDRPKLSRLKTFVVEVGGVNDDHYAILTQQQGVQHGDFPDGHPSSYHPRPTGLNFGAQTGTDNSLRCKPHSKTFRWLLRQKDALRLNLTTHFATSFKIGHATIYLHFWT